MRGRLRDLLTNSTIQERVFHKFNRGRKAHLLIWRGCGIIGVYSIPKNISRREQRTDSTARRFFAF